MSVYVDDASNPYGRYLMCHMWADTIDELLAMVDRIGVQRRWLQEPPKASWVHVDITQSKRRLAVQAGAIQTDKFGPVEHLAKRRGDNATLARVERSRSLRSSGALL